MLLADIDIPPDLDFARSHAMVFDAALAMRLNELHAEYGRPDCIASPTLLTDGRLALGCDLLTAVTPGGWLHAMWEAADKSILLPAVEILPWEEVAELLPEAPSQP